MAFEFEAPSIKLCYEISLLSLPVSRWERLLSLGPILCRGPANGPAKQHGSKNLILGFICGHSEGERGTLGTGRSSEAGFQAEWQGQKKSTYQ